MPELARRTKSAETFLLSAAALANLSFMSESAVSAMTRLGSAGVLITKSRPYLQSIYIQDQVTHPAYSRISPPA